MMLSSMILYILLIIKYFTARSKRLLSESAYHAVFNRSFVSSRSSPSETASAQAVFLEGL